MENTIMANKGEAKLKKFLITLGIVLGTFPVRAEFCDSVSPKEAQKIIGYLDTGTKIVIDEFINPYFVPEQLITNKVERQKDHILINGKNYDLLYTYALKNSDYENVALALNLECVSDFIYGKAHIPQFYKEKNTISKEKTAVLRKEFENCSKNNTGRSQTTADMLAHNAEEADCYQNVGNKLIDIFYSRNADKEKKVLDEAIKTIVHINKSIIQQSDYTKYDNGGTLNSVIISGNSLEDIKNLILKYLIYVENEQKSVNP